MIKKRVGNFMKTEDIIDEANRIRTVLLMDKELTRYVDPQRAYIPSPKVGSGKIKLIIIGQDPTVKNEKSRDKIKTVLNLDKKNSLYQYLSSIVEKLGDDVEENVYATNLLKCFYVAPPATIKNLVREHAPYWIELLKKELAQYPEAKIITLGEPVLDALVTNGSKKVREYWGYQGKNQADITKFHYCNANDNLILRKFFPFPHQPSIKKDFYRDTLESYLNFVSRH
jgi:hypothetical protein